MVQRVRGTVRPCSRIVAACVCASLLAAIVGGCPPTGTPTVDGGGEPDPLTRDEQITRAEQRGELTRSQAVLYRVWAAFSDDRLPPEFATLPPDLDAAGEAVREVVIAPETLDPEVLRELGPYLRRPNDPNSIFGRRLEAMARERSKGSGTGRAQARSFVWSSRLVVGQSMRIWAPSLVADHRALLDRAEAILDRVHPRLVALMGAPRADDGGPDQLFNPEDALDLYLLPRDVLSPRGGSDQKLANRLGLALPAPPFETGSGGQRLRSSAYLLVAADLDATELAGTLAHELFHAQQFAHSLALYGSPWLTEATASWAEHFALDRDGLDPEFGYVPAFMDTWGTDRGSLLRTRYGAFTYFLVGAGLASDQSIARIWQRLGTLAQRPDGPAQLDAVNALHPFASYLPALARRAWNEPSGARNFKDLDPEFPTEPTPDFEGPVALATGTTVQEPLPPTEPLAARYYWVLPEAQPTSLRVRLRGLTQEELATVRLEWMLTYADGVEAFSSAVGTAAADGWCITLREAPLMDAQLVVVHASAEPRTVTGTVELAALAEPCTGQSNCDLTHPKKLACTLYEDGSWSCAIIEQGPQCDVSLGSCGSDGCSSSLPLLEDAGGPRSCPDVVAAIDAFRALIAGVAVAPDEPLHVEYPLPDRLPCGDSTLCRSIILCPK